VAASSRSWPLIVADFWSEYGIRLHREFDDLRWVEFRDAVNGLLSADTRLGRYFNPKNDRTNEPGGDE
jgi:hypothetical protein